MLFRLLKFICFILFFTLSVSYAQTNDSIYRTSINWDDIASRERILADVPVWQPADIKSSFDMYLHPEAYLLPIKKNNSQYNLQFINAYWGPLHNPFNQFTRPAKAFVFLNSGKKMLNYYLAPLIQNTSDKNYYVFLNNEKQPILLNDWIEKLSISQTHENITFNICTGYGALPSDSCQDTNFQNETWSQLDTNEAVIIKPNPSAHRNPNEDWTTRIPAKENKDDIITESIFWKDVKARNALLNTVTAWANYTTIQDSFERIRDVRYFEDEESSQFMRRITWLYPDDGCWTRSAAFIKDFFGPVNNAVSKLPRPSKIFAFGNLCASTPNSPDGNVTWWYHTAPIIKDASTKQTYVLDPSINPYKPLTTIEWINAISSHTGACAKAGAKIEKFNICTGSGVSPYDNCQDNTVDFETETYEMLRQESYRSEERARQEVLKRDANKVLGDSPPWLN